MNPSGWPPPSGTSSLPNMSMPYTSLGSSSGGLPGVGAAYGAGPIPMGAVAVVPPGYPQPNVTAREYNPAAGFNVVEVYDRPYNEVSWPMCHDCHAYAPLPEDVLHSVELKTNKGCSICQTRPPRDQMFDGVRSFRINTDLVNGQPMLCHGAAALEKVVKLLPGSFTVQTVFQSLDSFLSDIEENGNEADVDRGRDRRVNRTIRAKIISSHQLTVAALQLKNFLDANPHELCTVFDEGDCPLGVYDQAWKRYFGYDLQKHLYCHRPGRPFPTVGEMIRSGIRVVVFFSMIDGPVCEPYPYFNSLWHNVWQSPWCIYDAEMMRRCTFPEDVGAHGDRGRGDWKAMPLFLWNHMFYSDGFPYLSSGLRAIIQKASNDFDLGDSSKAQMALGPFMNYNSIRVWTKTGKRPNFVNVDFYQGVGKFKSNLFPLCRALNRTWLLGGATTLPAPCLGVSVCREKEVGDLWTFATSTDGRLFFRNYDDARQHNKWNILYSKNALMVGRPAVVSGSRGEMRAYVLGNDGGLWRTSMSLSDTAAGFSPLFKVQTASDSVSYSITCDPVAISLGAGVFAIFCRDLQGAVTVVLEGMAGKPERTTLADVPKGGLADRISVCVIDSKVHIFSLVPGANHVPGSVAVLAGDFSALVAKAASAPPSLLGLMTWTKPTFVLGNFAGPVAVLNTGLNIFAVVRGQHDNLPYFFFYTHTEAKATAAVVLPATDQLARVAPCSGDLALVETPRGMTLLAQLPHESLIDEFVPPPAHAIFATSCMSLTNVRTWTAWRQVSPTNVEGGLSLDRKTATVTYLMQQYPFCTLCS